MDVACEIFLTITIKYNNFEGKFLLDLGYRLLLALALFECLVLFAVLIAINHFYFIAILNDRPD